VQVKFIQAERPIGWTAPAPAAAVNEPMSAPRVLPEGSGGKKEKPVTPLAMSLEDFKNDPLIQKALEVFKGQIVEVRA
jgi:hypothetical protein